MNIVFDRDREPRTRVGPYLEELCRDDAIADVVASSAAAMRELGQQESAGEVSVGYSLREQERAVLAVSRAAQRGLARGTGDTFSARQARPDAPSASGGRVRLELDREVTEHDAPHR